MGYPLPPYPPKPSRPAQDTVPAPLAMLAAEFDDTPFGSYGEMLPNTPAAPQIVTPSIQIPPADWEAEAAERGDALAPSETSDELPALAAIKPYEPEPFRLPDNSWTPLQRPQIPAVDWHEEEHQQRRPA